jgi:hypothetical protein
MRVQMRISEPADSRIRRGLLRIAASQVGSRGLATEISAGMQLGLGFCSLTDPRSNAGVGGLW